MLIASIVKKTLGIKSHMVKSVKQNGVGLRITLELTSDNYSPNISIPDFSYQAAPS